MYKISLTYVPTNIFDIPEALVFQSVCNAKGQVISKRFFLAEDSPKKRTNEFVFTTTMNSFVRFLGEFEDTKMTFRNYLTFAHCYYRIF